MKRYNSKTLHREGRALFFAAFSFLLFVSGLYIYFLSASVVHVVMRKELDREILHMSSYVSELESEYIEAQHSMSNRIATLGGFIETDEKIFINRMPDTLVLGDANGR